MDKEAGSHKTQAIEWTAPERLAVASLLHGGPLPTLERYRVLEIGCGDGANLIPLAYYRPQAEFLGIDQDIHQTNIAKARCTALRQHNIHFRNSRDLQWNDLAEGHFDFIIVHNLISHLPFDVRNQLLETCHNKLTENGLLYINYYSKPGWNVRGMVREYLLAHTRDAQTAEEKSTLAQSSANKMVRSLAASKHPYSRLLASEFQRVCEIDTELLDQEYLGPHLQAYWRSEFLELAEQFDFHFVIEADFNYSSGRTNTSLAKQIESQDLIGTNLTDTVDLLSYRQSHAPLFCKHHIQIPQPAPDKLALLSIASCLHPAGPHRAGWYQHPNGYQLQIQDPSMAYALDKLLQLWPDSAPISSLFEPNERTLDNLLTLHKSGLLELRIPNAYTADRSPHLNPLNQMELQWHRYYTSADHQRISHT